MDNAYRFRIEFWAVTGCVLLVGAIIELIRRNQLKERYSFLWLANAAVLVTFTLNRSWLEDFARILGVYYPPTALFLVLVFFMMLIQIHFSTVISHLLTDKQSLVQSVAMLEARVRDLEFSTRDQRQHSMRIEVDLVKEASEIEV